MVNWEFYKKDNSKEKLKWWMYIAIVFSFSLSMFLIYLYVDYRFLSPIKEMHEEVLEEQDRKMKEMIDSYKDYNKGPWRY